MSTTPGWSAPDPAPPGYGPAPGYAYPPPGPWGPPPPQQQTDGLAIASIATSISGVVLAGVTGPIGVGLGIASLRRIRRTGRQGRGLALAGLWVGAAMTLYLLGLVAVVVVTIASTSSTWSTAAGAGSWPRDGSSGPGASEDEGLADGLFPGDCLRSRPARADLQGSVVLDCALPHRAEVLAQVQLSRPVPLGAGSEDPVWSDADDRCQTVATGLAPDVHTHAVSVDLHHPSPDEWAGGRKSGYCVLSSAVGDLTGSLVRGDLAIDGVGVAGRT